SSSGSRRSPWRTGWRHRRPRDRRRGARRSGPRAARAAPARRKAGLRRPSGELLLAVDLVGVTQHRVHRLPAVAVEPAEEAGMATGVAGDAAHLLDLEQDHVGIAVEPDLAHPLHMPGFLALAPETRARTRPVDRPAAGRGFGERLAIHPREGEHATGARLLGDRRDEAVTVEADFLDPRGQGG